MSPSTRTLDTNAPTSTTSKYFASSKTPPRNFVVSSRRQSPRVLKAHSSSADDTQDKRSPPSTPSAEVTESSMLTTPELQSTDNNPRKKGRSKKATPGRPSKKAKAPKNTNTPRTHSFAPLTTDQLSNDGHGVVPHTLILGTHPSVASLEQSQYYGHPMNAFWWIAGDCLGFRRDTGISKSSGNPFGFAQHLRHTNILPYEEQLQMLLKHGFLLWDIVASCSRPGSLDQDIRGEVPNDIPGLCRQYPTIKRIVLANGGTAQSFFTKHFGDWMQECTDDGSITFVAGDDSVSQTHFAKYCQKLQNKKTKGTKSTKNYPAGDGTKSPSRAITLISAISVSPAAARYSYVEKLDFWENNVYKPGLHDYNEQQKNN